MFFCKIKLNEPEINFTISKNMYRCNLYFFSLFLTLFRKENVKKIKILYFFFLISFWLIFYERTYVYSAHAVSMGNSFFDKKVLLYFCRTSLNV